MGKMKNKEIPIVAIDFEGSRALGIVEYGAAEFLGGELVEVHTRLCCPLEKISERDAKFFDISDEQARKEKPFRDDLPLFIKLRQKGIFAAHNAIVEDSLLRAQAPSPALVPNFIDGTQTITWAPWLDSYIFCKNVYPALESAKLSNAIAALGLVEKLNLLAEKFCPPARRKWHCALYDAIACGLIYSHTCAQEGFENVSLGWLAKYSGIKGAQQRDFDSVL